MTPDTKAKLLFTKRDKILRQLAEIDQQLVCLRLEYMSREGIRGLRPENFRAAIKRTS